MSTLTTQYKTQVGTCKKTYRPKLENQNKLKTFLNKKKK